MPYATEQDLKDRLGSDLLAALADENGDGAPDTAILQAALDDASAEMDSTLALRYAVPVNPAPEILRRINADLAAHFLFLRRREAVSPEQLRRASHARAELLAWAEGRSDLEGAAPRLHALKSESLTREQEKIFGRDTLESY